MTTRGVAGRVCQRSRRRVVPGDSSAQLKARHNATVSTLATTSAAIYPSIRTGWYAERQSYYRTLFIFFKRPSELLYWPFAAAVRTTIHPTIVLMLQHQQGIGTPEERTRSRAAGAPSVLVLALAAGSIVGGLQFLGLNGLAPPLLPAAARMLTIALLWAVATGSPTRQ